VFWPGAVAALGTGAARSELEEYLHELERKQFVRREHRSSVAAETQYAFAHVLVRDVAHGQIPRGARAGKHLEAAGWIETLGRPEDKAEMLAHHYQSALDLARAAGLDTGDLAPRARSALHGAGDRALALNACAAAAGFYRAALGPWPQDAVAQRAGLLLRLALALGGAGEDADGAAMERARSALLAVGDRAGAAEAEARLGSPGARPDHYGDGPGLGGRPAGQSRHSARAGDRPGRQLRRRGQSRLLESLPHSPDRGRRPA
jgi:predicted ATPase